MTSLMPLFSCMAQDEEDEDFVTASILTAAPGDILYSCVGHACFRMQCPKYHLDYCFSYEGEDVHNQFLKFFAGKLKMGMTAAPSEEYLECYKKDHRGVKQYQLNIPLSAKKKLWEILDNKVAEGMNLPYDYLERGCAQTTLRFLQEALDSVPVDYAPWSEKYQQTRREFVASNIYNAPWSKFILYTIVGTDGDKDCSNFEKVVIPSDLIEVLQGAKINGTPIITEAPQEIVPAEQPTNATWCTPMLIAILFLALAIISWFIKVPYIDWAMLAVQTLIGIFILYLLLISTLPANSWNWLIIPFNPLPALFWKWRKKWLAPYIIIALGWILTMIFYPHQITDWAYVVFVASLITIYSKHISILKQKER